MIVAKDMAPFLKPGLTIRAVRTEGGIGRDFQLLVCVPSMPNSAQPPHFTLILALEILFGYTSDERDNCRSLIFSADVGLAESLFMFGARASFSACPAQKHGQIESRAQQWWGRMQEGRVSARHELKNTPYGLTLSDFGIHPLPGTRQIDGGIMKWWRRWVPCHEVSSGWRTSRPARFLAAIMLAAFASVLAPDFDAQARGYLSTVKPVMDIRKLESRLHELVNAERVRHGLPPLRHIETLRLIARSHSKDMAKRAYFAHTNPEGRNPTARGDLAGYNCRKGYDSNYTYGLGENIHQAWLYKSYKTRNGRIVSYDWFTPEGLAQRVVTGWMNSKRHKKNILKASYDRSGMGVAIAKDGKVFSTQNFC